MRTLIQTIIVIAIVLLGLNWFMDKNIERREKEIALAEKQAKLPVVAVPVAPVRKPAPQAEAEESRKTTPPAPAATPAPPVSTESPIKTFTDNGGIVGFMANLIGMSSDDLGDRLRTLWYNLNNWWATKFLIAVGVFVLAMVMVGSVSDRAFTRSSSITGGAFRLIKTVVLATAGLCILALFLIAASQSDKKITSGVAKGTQVQANASVDFALAADPGTKIFTMEKGKTYQVPTLRTSHNMCIRPQIPTSCTINIRDDQGGAYQNVFTAAPARDILYLVLDGKAQKNDGGPIHIDNRSELIWVQLAPDAPDSVVFEVVYEDK